jgi:hypothetical protein
MDGMIDGMHIDDAIAAFAAEIMAESPGVYSGYAYVVELYRADGSKPLRFAYAGSPAFFQPGGIGEGRWVEPPPGEMPDSNPAPVPPARP